MTSAHQEGNPKSSETAGLFDNLQVPNHSKRFPILAEDVLREKRFPSEERWLSNTPSYMEPIGDFFDLEPIIQFLRTIGSSKARLN